MPPPVPPKYAEAFRRLPASAVEFGCFGIQLFPVEELADEQIGYSGEDWSSTWLVIGIQVGLGDPLFIDTAAPSMPVFTAMHGMGEWSPDPVAGSLEQFARALEVFARVAVGRADPAELKTNPVKSDEAAEYMREISAIVDIPCVVFWGGLIDS